jgi:hypothetical protein
MDSKTMDSKTLDIKTLDSKSALEVVRMTIMAGVIKLDRESETYECKTHECKARECKIHGCDPRVVVACHLFLQGAVPAGQCLICRTKEQTLFEIRTRGRTAAPAIICLTCGTAPTVRDLTAHLMSHAPQCLACDRRCQTETGLGDQIFAVCSDECSSKITDRIMTEFRKELPEGVTSTVLKMCDWCTKLTSSAMARCSRCTTTVYCSHACRKAARPAHKKDCGRH